MPDQQETRIGQQIGEYRLVRKLGGGGFGTVYLAQHVHEHTQAAIKVLDIRLTKSEDFKDFINEASTMVRLRHPHIVPLLNFGISRNDLPFLVMEYASGGTLRDRHPKGKRIPLPTIVSYADQLATALQHAHDQHVIHRDIKPENILVHADGTLLVSDFGLAKLLEQSVLLSVQTQVGTPVYMAPEQHKGYPCFASDQYALAIIAYEWICGTRPFQGSREWLAVQHVTVPPPPLRNHLPTLPEAVEHIILQALAKAPEDRFGRIQEFADALREAVQLLPSTVVLDLLAEASDTVPLISSKSSGQTVAMTPPSSLPNPLPPPKPLWRRERASKPDHSRRKILLGLVGLGVVVGIPTWQWLVHLRPQTTSPQPSLPKTDPSQSTLQNAIYHGHTDKVTSASWSPDGKHIASSSADGTVQVWDTPTGEHALIYRGHTAAVVQAVWSPDGTKIASSSVSEGTVQEWQALTGKSIFTYNTRPAYTNDIAWSHDGRYLAIGVRGSDHGAGPPQKTDSVQIWGTTSHQIVHTYACYFPEGIAWSPDGKYLAVNSTFGETTIIDIATGDSSISHSGFMNSMECVAWSPDGRYVASASDNGTIHIWEPKGSTHQAIYVFGTPQSGSMHAVSWSPNGKRIASGDSDGRVQVWDAFTGEHLTTYNHSDIVTCVQWSPDGRFILSGSNDQTVRIWRAP